MWCERRMEGNNWTQKQTKEEMLGKRKKERDQTVFLVSYRSEDRRKETQEKAQTKLFRQNDVEWYQELITEMVGDYSTDKSLALK